MAVPSPMITAPRHVNQAICAAKDKTRLVLPIIGVVPPQTGATVEDGWRRLTQRELMADAALTHNIIVLDHVSSGGFTKATG